MGDLNKLIKEIVLKYTKGNMKRVMAKVISVNNKHKATVSIIGTNTELTLPNKTGEKLAVGDNVHIHYWGNITSGYIAVRNGEVHSSGVGEDLGNGNERFNDYVGNTVSFNSGSEGEYNTLKGHGNTIVGEADGNSVAGDSNRIAAGDNNSVAGSHNQVIGSNGSNNAVEGEYNVVSGGGNTVSGDHNAVGVMPQVPLLYLLNTMAANYTGTPDEKAGNLPAFMLTQGATYSAGSSAVGQYNAVYEESTAIGERNAAKKRSAAVGYANAADSHSTALGEYCVAYHNSIAIGDNCSAGTPVSTSSGFEPWNSPPSSIFTAIEQAGLGFNSAAIGSNVKNHCAYTFAFGKDIIAANQADYMLILGEGLTASGSKWGAILGKYNDTASDSEFQVGDGSSNSRRNIFEFDANGDMYITGSYQTLGADYAEYEEWLDGNPNDEDRIGHFVTYEGDKIRFTNATDDYILGVVSATPSIIGDSDISHWRKKYEQDIFWRPVLDEEGKPVISNEYDPEKKYTPRSKRKEWSPVGTHGKLIVIDDGTCVVNGYCKPTDGGIGTKSETMQGAYRVIERLDDTHIRIRIR